MFEEKDLSRVLASEADGENSRCQGKMSVEQVPEKHMGNPEDKMEFCDKGTGFLKETMKVSGDGDQSKSSKVQNSNSQELLIHPDDPKLPGFLEKQISGKNLLNSLEKLSYKGKEVIVPENTNPDGKWVERDFLSLSGSRGNSSKRPVDEEDQEVEKYKDKEKKPKLETLNLSLCLPDVSLSLTASNVLRHNGDPPPPVKSKPSMSIQSLVPSANNTQTTCSNDFTAASLSYSYSHQFSHNPSCSLTRNSTENFDYSVSKDDPIWNCGEGTNGSVHSRFKPIGDGANFSNHGGGGLFSMMQSSVHCKTATSSDNHSSFPSELPARPRVEIQSVDTKDRQSENLKVLESVDVEKVKKICRPDRILRDIISKSIPTMSHFIQELPVEAVISVKKYLQDLIEEPEKKDELVSLQKSLERRSDFTKEALLKCHREGLEILVSIKMGLASYLSGKVQISNADLSEVFLFMKCRNVNCKSILPFDDCDCNICSSNRGFCSSCMCPVCLNFDCANNTCSWVGCDVCSHWCHAACGIHKNLIRPGPSLKGPAGTSEMQFHCIGCGHASEMFGFVKDVFLFCAKDWGQEALMKELECVRRIFKGSEDFKGKELHNIADDILFKLQTKMASPSDACNLIIQFFNFAGSTATFNASGLPSKTSVPTQSNLGKEVVTLARTSYLSPNRAHCEVSYPRSQSDSLSKDLRSTILNDVKSRDEFRVVSSLEKSGFDSLETIVKIKEAEGRMFEEKAEEARRAAEGFKKMMKTKMDKLEEEYVQKLGKLCLQEIEDKRRKKLEELKVLENSHCDYYKMKIRMQAEIASLLERMEATKQKWV